MRMMAALSWLTSILIVALLALISSILVIAQSKDDLAALNAQVAKLSDQGKYSEATEIAMRSLALAEKDFGPHHTEVANSLNELAVLHWIQGRYADAEPLYKRSLAVREKALGPEHPDVATSLHNLAGLYWSQRRYDEAELLYNRSLPLREKALGPEHPEVATLLGNLAVLYMTQRRNDEAEQLFKRSLALREKALGSEHADVAKSLHNLAQFYLGQGRYADAEPLYTRCLAVRENVLGPEHPDVVITLNNLAGLYGNQGRYAEAELLHKRGLALAEKNFGPHHPEVATSLNNLASQYQRQGRYTEAEPLLMRSLALREKALGFEHPDVANSLNNLAVLYHHQGRYAEAEPLMRRSLALRERALEPEHPDVANSLNNLAGLYEAQGRYAEAEPLMKRSLALHEKALGPDHPDVGTSLMSLAGLYEAQGRYAEAEPLFKRSLALREKALGPDHPDVGSSLNNLAELYATRERYAEAEPLFKRSLALREKALGPEHPSVAGSLNSLAGLYQAQFRYAEAEPLFKRSLALREKALGPDHPSVGASLNNLALLHDAQGRYAEAEPLMSRSLALFENALGPEHPSVAASLNNLAALYDAQGRYAEAEPLMKRSLALREKALGPDHPDVGTSLNNLAVRYLVQSDWARAADFWRRSTAITVRRVQRGMESARGQFSGNAKSETYQFGSRFYGLVKVLHRLASEQPGNDTALTAETFVMAQWVKGSEAAASLAQMAVRGAGGNPQLATIVRERQDLIVEWQKRDGARTAAVSQPPDKRDAKAEVANLGRLAEIDTRIAVIDKRMTAEFPDYAALASSEPLAVEQVQADLRADEALVLFLDTFGLDPIPEETFIWVVTKTAVRWVRSDLGAPALIRQVATLRCGLDGAVWEGVGSENCADLLKLPHDAVPSAGELPFHTARAHFLYNALFGQVEDLIKGKHLLIVPSGALTQLPFQVLVTKLPTNTDYKTVRWLARDHALTVLPAVSSLRALRRLAKSSVARRPLIGFGNPLLDGPADGRFSQQAKLAQDKQRCADQVRGRVASQVSFRRSGIAPFAMTSGLADATHIRSQVPLPETADELCAVARDLKADVREIRLGSKATEHEVKALSASGVLAGFRIVHFATHGALAGQLRGATEPGLILTPPQTANEDDDGYLSASEIAGLKLDADWVILSACNTAAPNSASVEALSGLARAFFFAQARALLVSHWDVNSDATVKLITSAVGEIARDKTVGRAEALRRAMLALMSDKDRPWAAHPAFWAPFVVVGEGAAAR